MRKFIVIFLALIMTLGVAISAAGSSSEAEATGEFSVTLNGGSSSLYYNALISSVSAASDGNIDQGYVDFGRMGYLTARSVNPYFVAVDAIIYRGGSPIDNPTNSFGHRLAVKTTGRQAPAGNLGVSSSLNGVDTSPDNSSASPPFPAGWLYIDGQSPTIMDNSTGTGGFSPDKANLRAGLDLTSNTFGAPLIDDSYTVTLNFTLTAP